MSADIDEPVESAGATTHAHQATDVVMQGVGQGSSRDVIAGRDDVIDEDVHDTEGHADLDAYRTSRRLSRPNSRLRHSFSPDRSSTTPQIDVEAPDNDEVKDKHDGAPLCLVAYTHRVEACTRSIQAWSDRQEEKARSKKDAKADARVTIKEDGTVVEPKGETWFESHIVIFIVAIILSWIYIVFVWRICVAGIRMETRAEVTRGEGIGLLVGFNILWLITIWTYVRVVMTPPGFVRDYVNVSPEAEPQAEGTGYTAPAAYPGVDSAPREYSIQSTQQAVGQDKMSGSVKGGEETVDPSLPAVIGPLGAGQVAKMDEEKALISQQQTAQASDPTPWSHHAPPNGNNTPPEPFRGPSSLLPPLHTNQLYCYRCKRVKPPRAHHCRRCATCVLQMDHHCPWVGGCVGARNHKYFYHFLQWVTALEYFVLVVDAIVFHRGIKRRSASAVPGWSIDGYLISMFPICAMFILFTTALLITHSYLFMLNLTTIEHMAYDRMQRREDILLSNYLDARRSPSTGEKLGFWERLKEKRRIKAKWSEQWGNLKSEANLWWIDDRDKAMKKEERGQKTTWYHSIGPNWRQALGESWHQSFFPIGRAKSDGLSYDMNWRFAQDGSWRPRVEWQRLKERLE